ncbi:MAG TPA: protein-L-isoaspartate(D-aspartate) O-methyltransferase [Clostridia bacterium]|nr:protein-L-isoaspartate(D-aspartate) O-methyltransferase [Clostridia bacterium]
MKAKREMDNRKKIISYFNELDRSYFMDDYKERASWDMPFPIGYGQTISQPSLVLEMTLLLNPDQDSKVLELGTGSGFQTALLAKASKIVYTVERIEALYLSAQERLREAGYSNIKFKLDDGNLGWEEHAPYDRIMVTAAASSLPDKLIDQLAPNGKMIIPVGSGSVQDLLYIRKNSQGNIEKEMVEKVSFVRLIGEY